MNEEEYFINWPESYYMILEPWRKLKVLEKHIDAYHLKEDEERLEMFHKRYEIIKGNYIDKFTLAFLTIRNMRDTNVNFLNRNKMNEELIKALMDLRLYDEVSDSLEEEWHYFMKEYIQVSSKSFSRPAFLGMGKRSEDKVNEVVKENIQTILVDIPHRFLLEDTCKPLLDIAYIELKKCA